MKTRTNQLLTVIVVVSLAVAVYSTTVFAQTSAPSTPTTMLQWMQERLGPEAWAQRVERMTQLHGTEFVSQMMTRMAQQPSGPCINGTGAGMPSSMRGQGMMRQGMMGQGMQVQGRSWGFHQSMGPRVWNNPPAATPTPAQ